MTCIAVYFLTFSFVTQETPIMEVVFSVTKVYMSPLDAALVALSSFNVTDTLGKTLRKRSLGHQPKDKT